MESHSTFFEKIQLDCSMKPSLEDRAIIKISSELWNQEDMRGLIYNSAPRMKEYKNTLLRVKKIASTLFLPELIKQKLLSFINPIGLEILKWMEQHNDVCSLNAMLLNKFCWTPQGTIDNQKTAEALIINEEFDIISRFKLACIYCSEDNVRRLWKQITLVEKRNFFRAYNRNPVCVGKDSIVNYWLHQTQSNGEINTNNIFNEYYTLLQHVIRSAIVTGNNTATKYFFKKLTIAEKRKVLMKCAKNYFNDYTIENVNTFCLILSFMDKEQQTVYFQTACDKVLMCFVEWPWQDFLIEVSSYLCDFLSLKCCSRFLRCLAYKMRIGEGYNYKHVFKMFWLSLPIAHRQYAITVDRYLLYELFLAVDVENTQLVLKDATESDKEVFFNTKGKGVCTQLICSNKWDGINFFFEECLLNEAASINFKNSFPRVGEKRKIRLHQLIDDVICKKRKLE